MENIKDLYKQIAVLESQLDLMESEYSYLNELLVRCGFPFGVLTLKATVEELLIEEPHPIDSDDSSEKS